jgi:hypothetical protein
MAQYQYTAVNQGGKKLTGFIGASDEEAARKQLNSFGISVLGIQKIAESDVKGPAKETQTSSELPTYEFEAYDKTSRKVLGTIPASSRYKAFKRLMDEYQFEVAFVVEMGADNEQREQAKKEGLDVLKAEYELQEKSSGKDVENLEKEKNEAFEEKRQALLLRVDFILEKIKNILASYETEIKVENKKIIQTAIDKLLRIKSSTNLDYIEHTSEELLKKVQNQELFLHKEQMASARAKVKLETTELMAQLHNRPQEQKDVFEGGLAELQSKIGDSQNKLLKGISQQIQNYLPSEAEKELKKRIHVVKKQVWTFRKIWLSAKKDTKLQARMSLMKIIAEEKRLKAELLVLKKKRHPEKIASPKENGVMEPLITEEITSFLAWLLVFYLAVYFFSHYMSFKVIPGGSWLPGDFNLLASSTLRTLLISLFLWYALLNLRVQYFRYEKWANVVVIPLGILVNLTLILNF